MTSPIPSYNTTALLTQHPSIPKVVRGYSYILLPTETEVQKAAWHLENGALLTAPSFQLVLGEEAQFGALIELMLEVAKEKPSLEYTFSIFRQLFSEDFPVDQARVETFLSTPEQQACFYYSLNQHAWNYERNHPGAFHRYIISV